MTPVQKPTFEGAGVTLRQVAPGDVERRTAHGYTPEIMRVFGGDPDALGPMTRRGAERWCAQHRDDPYAWIVEHAGDLIGAVRLHSFVPEDRRAAIGAGLVDPASLGKGLGTQSLRLMIRYAFGSLHLHRLSARVLAFNTRAIAAYAKLGFVCEGRERGAARIGSVFHDDLIMGVLPHEAAL